MPRFSANISTLFQEHSFLDRFGAARAADFEAVECQFVDDYAPETLKAAQRENGLAFSVFSIPPGDLAAGDRGLACLPGREAEFEATVETALSYADALDCPMMHCLAGLAPAAESMSRLVETLTGNVRRAAEAAKPAGATILLEPKNARDMPGYMLADYDLARRVIEAAGMDNVRLMFDVYHRQVIHGDLVQALRDFRDITGHIQIANPPDRREPGKGEIDFRPVFAEIDASGYAGWVGCEYIPTGATADSLGWFEDYRQRAG